MGGRQHRLTIIGDVGVDLVLGPISGWPRVGTGEPIERTPILPREIFGRFVNESFWMNPKNNISQVPIV